MLGHELRHPLTPITHAIYLLRKSNQDPATIELLDTIDTQTQTLLRFVNELLDLSRISRGVIEIRPERLDLAAVARDAVHALQPFIEERRHVVSLVLPAALYVRGDPGRLRQVVSNLVENAAKYTEPGGRITVTLEQRGDEAVLAVRDNGIGIDAENLERIFEPFTQSHQPLGNPLQWIGNRTQRRAPNRGTAWWSREGDQRGCRCGKRVRGLAAGVGGRHARRPRVRESREHLGAARGLARPKGNDCRRSPRDQGLDLASCPRLGSRSRRRRRRLECALAGGSIPARVRHRGSLNAGDERDRAGSSSPPTVSSGAALPDRPQWLSRARTSATRASPQVSTRISSSQGTSPSWSNCSEATARMLLPRSTDPTRLLSQPESLIRRLDHQRLRRPALVRSTVTQRLSPRLSL